MENKIKHLEMIQGIINRMAFNSFSLKGWSVTLVAGIFALSNKDTDKMYFLLAYIPILTFWFLDAYYLQQERKYRNLYNHVRKLEESNINFDMNANANHLMNKKTVYRDSLFSITEAGFYLPLGLLSAIVINFTELLKLAIRLLVK